LSPSSRSETNRHATPPLTPRGEGIERERGPASTLRGSQFPSAFSKLERSLQWPAPMLLGRLISSALGTLLLGCASVPPPPPAVQAKQTEPHYTIIQADVSLSRTAQPAQEKQAALDPNTDVMAEILAIPPGR
jgi:hypothetical protein